MIKPTILGWDKENHTPIIKWVGGQCIADLLTDK